MTREVAPSTPDHASTSGRRCARRASAQITRRGAQCAVGRLKVGTVPRRERRAPRVGQMREKREESNVQITRRRWRGIAPTNGNRDPPSSTASSVATPRIRPRERPRSREASRLGDDRAGAAVDRRGRDPRHGSSSRLVRRVVDGRSRIVGFLAVPPQAEGPSEAEAWIRNKPWTGGDHGPRTKEARVDPA